MEQIILHLNNDIYYRAETKFHKLLFNSTLITSKVSNCIGIVISRVPVFPFLWQKIIGQVNLPFP